MAKYRSNEFSTTVEQNYNLMQLKLLLAFASLTVASSFYMCIVYTPMIIIKVNSLFSLKDEYINKNTLEFDYVVIVWCGITLK